MIAVFGSEGQVGKKLEFEKLGEVVKFDIAL